MKGIIFNLVEDVITAEHGADTWDDLLDEAGVDGAYTSLGNYPDDDLHRLVGAAARELEMPGHEVVRSLGRRAIPLLAARYPQLFVGHDLLSFLLTLNEIIHPEVRKLYPGADVPDFTFATPEPSVLEMGYSSARKLCALAEGFVLGAADHYGEAVVISQPVCMLRGDECCVLVCSFAST